MDTIQLKVSGAGPVTGGLREVIKGGTLLASKYYWPIPQLAFFVVARTATVNSWVRSKITLLHRGASIKTVDISNSTKRPFCPSLILIPQAPKWWQTR